MRIIRYQYQSESPKFGWLQDSFVGPIEGNPFQGFRRLEPSLPLEKVKLLPPTQPTKIICVGRNYIAHAEEHGAEVPKIPLIFLKPPSALLAPGDPIHLPTQSQQVEHEGELVIVIGRTGRLIAPEEAAEFVFGYTVGNDVTARDLQNSDGQWTRSKGFDTFCPIGPWIETEFNPADALLTCHVNGQMRQMASTRDMVFSTSTIISFASSVMTLEAGDIIMTGTPAGVSPLSPGDVVEVTIEGIGKLSNPVAGS
jgi:2-keto-4-pentenoate hydratase/2-oxohepta-3-ene-1,7-dioic acid hydratase in catechol pathway